MKPKTPGPKHHKQMSIQIEPQVHSHAMSVIVRDKEVGTSQSDITPTSHGGPLNLPLCKMVHFNVKQSLCCVIFCRQVLVISKESPTQTKKRCLNYQVQSQ